MSHTQIFSVFLRSSTILLFLLHFAPVAQAQDDVVGPTEYAPSTIFAELGGNGILYSINYDYKFVNHASARIGGMYAQLEDENTEEKITTLLIPTMVNYLLGNGNSRLEIGIGPLWAFARGDLPDLARTSGFGLAGITSTLGYRLQPVDGGFHFRIGLTPFYSEKVFQLWGGLGFGFGF